MVEPGTVIPPPYLGCVATLEIPKRSSLCQSHASWFRFPQVTRGLVLHWPVGGAEWIRVTHERWLGVHAGFVKENGFGAVVELAREKKSFMADFRGGPWASVIARDAEFAARFAAQNVDAYLKLLGEITTTLYDRDTAPGAEPEEL